jgi:hypothetical protein
MQVCIIFDLAIDSYIWHQKHEQQKENIDKWSFIKKINIRHTERYYQESENITHRMGENICKLYILEV